MRYIYLIKDPFTKRVVWVGETSKPHLRYKQHAWGSKKDSKEKKEWLKNIKAAGLKPLFEIIDSAENKPQAIVKENNYLCLFMKMGHTLFNVNNRFTIKGYALDGTLIYEFANARLAKKLTGIAPRIDRKTAGSIQWTYGCFNPELFKQLEAAKKVLCKPVLQIDKAGNIINEFEGVRIAYKETGIDHRSISAVAGGSSIRKTAGGYLWKYKEN